MSLIEEARTVRDRIAARLRELEPLVREYNELSKLAAEMGLEAEAPQASSASPGEAVAPARKQSARRSKPREKTRSAPAAATPSRPDEVSQRVLDAVRSDPGKTVAEYADILSVSPTTLYRPVRELTNDGQLVKRGRQLYLP